MNIEEQMHNIAKYLSEVYFGLPVSDTFQLDVEFEFETPMYSVLVAIDQAITKDKKSLVKSEIKKLYVTRSAKRAFRVTSFPVEPKYSPETNPKPEKDIEIDVADIQVTDSVDEVRYDLEILERATFLIAEIEKHALSLNPSAPVLSKTGTGSTLTKYIEAIEEQFIKPILE